MQIVNLVLCLLQVAGVSDFAHTGEAGESRSSEANAKDGMQAATAVMNDFAPYVDERQYLEEQEFVARFNNLLKALRDFASAYTPGHVIDVKKVKAIRKAMHGLEKSGWFRPQKED